MTLAYRLYSGAQVLVLLLGVGAGLLVFSGVVGTTSPPVPLPEPTWLASAGLVGGGIAGFLLLGYLKIRTWLGLGRAAGLSPDEGTGPLSRTLAVLGAILLVGSPPDLSGTVGGREVRVRSYASGSGGRGVLPGVTPSSRRRSGTRSTGASCSSGGTGRPTRTWPG